MSSVPYLSPSLLTIPDLPLATPCPSLSLPSCTGVRPLSPQCLLPALCPGSDPRDVSPSSQPQLTGTLTAFVCVSALAVLCSNSGSGSGGGGCTSGISGSGRGISGGSGTAGGGGWIGSALGGPAAAVSTAGARKSSGQAAAGAAGAAGTAGAAAGKPDEGTLGRESSEARELCACVQLLWAPERAAWMQQWQAQAHTLAAPAAGTQHSTIGASDVSGCPWPPPCLIVYQLWLSAVQVSLRG